MLFLGCLRAPDGFLRPSYLAGNAQQVMSPALCLNPEATAACGAPVRV